MTVREISLTQDVDWIYKVQPWSHVIDRADPYTNWPLTFVFIPLSLSKWCVCVCDIQLGSNGDFCLVLSARNTRYHNIIIVSFFLFLSLSLSLSLSPSVSFSHLLSLFIYVYRSPSLSMSLSLVRFL